jgi:signal transduction histidine kinase
MNSGDKVNILLVDDQPPKLLTYEVILAELGENLIKVTSARDALDALLRNEIAIVLTDVSMPELDGFELAEMIRGHPRFQRTSIIFVSGIHMSDVDLLRGYQVGAVDYVPVPVVPELLRAKVKVFAELYRKTRQLETLNAELEKRVADRTTELAHANAELEERVEERTRQREAALAQLHEVQKMESLGQLTGGVAHDFNNLLMVILGNLNLVLRETDENSRTRRLIDGAIAAADLGATLTRRMMAFARRQDLQPKPVDVPVLFQGMTDMLLRTLGPTIEIVSDFAGRLPLIVVDPNQFELALLNLALNARDAMPRGGKLSFSACVRPPPVSLALQSGGYLCITVSDTGRGMDDATVKRATEPFFTTKEVGKGTGLGLSMVHGLVAQSGGGMTISSEVDHGTRIRLWFPTANTEVQSKPPENPPVRDTAPLRVLVVEDNLLVLMTTAALLEDADHDVVTANSAAEALTLLAEDPMIDLVITDQAMPGMTGIDLARRLNETHPGLPIILCSGYVDVPQSDDLRLVRLSKPFRQEDLLGTIARILETRVESASRQNAASEAVSIGPTLVDR